MSAEGARLSSSPFIANLTPKEKSWWRVLVTLLAGGFGGFILALLGGIIALLVLAAAAGALSGSIPQMANNVISLVKGQSSGLIGAMALLVLAAASNTPWAAAFIVIAALMMGRPVLRYLTAAPRFRWRLLLSGLLISGLFVGVIVAVGQLTDPHAPPPPMLSVAPDLSSRLIYVVACILLLIPAAAAEEVLFRGWLLRETAGITRNPWVLMALNGILFSAIHGLNAPSELQPDPFLTRALMGAGFVYMTLRVGGVELSTGAHAANNILIVLFIEPLTLSSNSPPGMHLDAALQDLFLFFSYVLLAEMTVRWAPLRRWAGVDQARSQTSQAIAAAEPSA